MKKRYFLVLIMFLALSILNVNAVELCDQTIADGDKNFYCGDKNNKNLSFKANNVIYTSYFDYKEDKIIIKDMKGLMKSLPTDQKEVKITIKSDGKTIGYVTVENSNYKEPTTTTTTVANTQKYTIIFDHNDGTGEKTERQCETTSNGGSCPVNAPKLENDNFNGWGTQSTCKQGGSGRFTVEKDTTYYACYETNEVEEEQEVTSNSLSLKSLKMLDQLTNKEIDIGTFKSDVEKYKFSVENSVTNIKVVPVVDDTIKVDVMGNVNLKEGENTLTIKLTGEDAEEKIYTFTVTRLKSGEVVDKNHYLANLTIPGYPISFDKTVKVYTVTIKSNVKELIINADPENPNDEVKIIANSDLVNGSTIKINVTGDDGEPTIYTINIIKEGMDNKLIMIIAGVIIFLILILTVVVFVKSNKKGDGNTTPKETKKKESKTKIKTTTKTKTTKATKKNKKAKNAPEVLPDANEDIEILKF